MMRGFWTVETQTPVVSVFENRKNSGITAVITHQEIRKILTGLDCP